MEVGRVTNGACHRDAGPEGGRVREGRERERREAECKLSPHHHPHGLVLCGSIERSRMKKVKRGAVVSGGSVSSSQDGHQKRLVRFSPLPGRGTNGGASRGKASRVCPRVLLGMVCSEERVSHATKPTSSTPFIRTAIPGLLIGPAPRPSSRTEVDRSLKRMAGFTIQLGCGLVSARNHPGPPSPNQPSPPGCLRGVLDPGKDKPPQSTAGLVPRSCH